MFDVNDRAAHGQIFKLNQGDGFPVQHAAYRLLLLSSLEHKVAQKEFKAALPMKFIEMVVVNA